MKLFQGFPSTVTIGRLTIRTETLLDLAVILTAAGIVAWDPRLWSWAVPIVIVYAALVAGSAVLKLRKIFNR